MFRQEQTPDAYLMPVSRIGAADTRVVGRDQFGDREPTINVVRGTPADDPFLNAQEIVNRRMTIGD